MKITLEVERQDDGAYRVSSPDTPHVTVVPPKAAPVIDSFFTFAEYPQAGGLKAQVRALEDTPSPLKAIANEAADRFAALKVALVDLAPRLGADRIESLPAHVRQQFECANQGAFKGRH